MDVQKSRKDEQFATLKSVADGIAALFYPVVEVAIHSVKSGKIAYLANNISKRSIGDDAGLEELSLHDLESMTGPYEKLNWDGKKMRSVSIRANVEGEAEYIFCINFSTTLLDDAKNALDMILSINRLQPQPVQLFKHDWQEKINTFLHQWLKQNNTSLSTLSRHQKKDW
ncbi:PAS domain-containing protein [Escherichia sp. E1130]|uniref:PAS domain-containing protein n=1 Tax=Escherichia sp. E1130 TaxID=2041645 RepID=UPI001F0F5EE1|nr:PAS domain-containing protein [Escherichia sp. E1130]